MDISCRNGLDCMHHCLQKEMFEERNTVECGGSPVPQIEVHRERKTDVYPSVDTNNFGRPEYPYT